jgi:hypothetical protein
MPALKAAVNRKLNVLVLAEEAETACTDAPVDGIKHERWLALKLLARQRNEGLPALEQFLEEIRSQPAAARPERRAASAGRPAATH